MQVDTQNLGTITRHRADVEQQGIVMSWHKKQGLNSAVGCPNVLKSKFHSHHQMERVDGSQAGR